MTIDNKPSESSFSPRDFMRARRPELYSDSFVKEEFVLTKQQLEFLLETLGNRKQENEFEHFGRRLAEREICPNLTLQTGSTAGGDRKVDSETYPVAEEIAQRWYEGETGAAKERWAICISTQVTWQDKVRKDVKKAVETGRGYKKIFFISSRYVKDRETGNVQDDLDKQLSTEYGVQVTVLDRSWIIEKVVQNARWEEVLETLDVEHPNPRILIDVGPNDARRRRDLEELDRKIDDPTRYQHAKHQLAVDCLATAMLACYMERTRAEVDGRFARAERIARDEGLQQLLFRILYKRAWFAYYWFDDFNELDRLYESVEEFALKSTWVWDVDNLANLWNSGISWKNAESSKFEGERWKGRTQRLHDALVRHAEVTERVTGSLWASTQLAFMKIVKSSKTREELSPIFRELQAILSKVEGRVDYPVDQVTQIIDELGGIVENDQSYDDLREVSINLKSKRDGEASEGRKRLDRGFQKLQAGDSNKAIEEIAKAQRLLAKDEHTEDFIRALTGTALAYESAGLLWAARANAIFGLDRHLFDASKNSQSVPIASLAAACHLAWLELQLGRVPCVLDWLELLAILSNKVELSDEDAKRLSLNYQMLDRTLGALILKSKHSDLQLLKRMPVVLEKLGMPLSRSALIFALGHEDKFNSEVGFENDNDVNESCSKWVSKIGEDIPNVANWHTEKTIAMRTVILGCEIEFLVQNNKHSIILGEALIAFIEAFMSTSIAMPGLFSVRSSLKIDIREIRKAKPPFSWEVKENSCGETEIFITHPRMSAAAMALNPKFIDALPEFLGDVLEQCQFNPIMASCLEELFEKQGGLDRSVMAAKMPIGLENIRYEFPKLNIQDWSTWMTEETFDVHRSEQWKPICSNVRKDADTVGANNKNDNAEQKPLFGIDALRHKNMSVQSPIYLPLWEKAGWSGVALLGYAEEPGNLILMFKNKEVAEKIFRGWQKRLGSSVDSEGWLGLTVIKGISKKQPLDYRLAIGINEAYLQSHESKTDNMMALVHRMQDMHDVKLLDQFLDHFHTVGKYQLRPAYISGREVVPCNPKLFIEKNELKVVEAWQIGPNDFLASATDGISDPIIPENVSDAPILETLKKFEEAKKRFFESVKQR